MPDYQIELTGEYTSNSEDDTFNIGQYIASCIKAVPDWRSKNFVVALSGELGSGKTILTKGIAKEFGIADCITSPTYTIVNEYEIYFNHEPHEKHEKIILYHVDTYRLNNEQEFTEIGGQEILSSNSICIIEWADKIKNLLPSDTITINIEITGSETRKITIQGITL